MWNPVESLLDLSSYGLAVSERSLALPAREYGVLADYQEQLAALKYPGRART